MGPVAPSSRDRRPYLSPCRGASLTCVVREDRTNSPVEADQRPADDAEWGGVPNATNRRLLSTLLLVAVVVVVLALALWSGLTAPFGGSPPPTAAPAGPAFVVPASTV